MTVHQFVEFLKHDADRFREHWVTQGETDGLTRWPLTMDEPEWAEQFEAWRVTKEKEAEQ